VWHQSSREKRTVAETIGPWLTSYLLTSYLLTSYLL